MNNIEERFNQLLETAFKLGIEISEIKLSHKDYVDFGDAGSSNLATNPDENMYHKVRVLDKGEEK